MIKSIYSFFFFFFFLMGLEFELRASYSTPPVHFALVIFGDGVFLCGLALDCDPPDLSLLSS
jgi:hypothetical protein